MSLGFSRVTVIFVCLFLQFLFFFFKLNLITLASKSGVLYSNCILGICKINMCPFPVMLWKRRLFPFYTIKSKELFQYSIGRQRLRQSPNIMDAAIQSLRVWTDFRHCQLHIYERRWEQQRLEQQNIGIEKTWYVLLMLQQHNHSHSDL